jgi:transposase
MRKYNQSFKDEAIRLALTSTQPIGKITWDLGLKEATLYNWVSAAKDKAPTILDGQGAKTNLVDELNRLRKENARLKEEREMLKKAALSSTTTLKHSILTRT